MLSQKIGISSSTLKIIAIITMLIDHIGGILFPQYVFLRIIGRLAFPIFCFLLVEGFLHTHNVYSYALRLGLFALISEVPFDLAIYHVPFYPYHQNVFFTLLIGLLVLIGFKNFQERPFIQLMIFAVGAFLALKCQVDYGVFGVAMIVLIYLYSIHHNFLILALGFVFLNFLAKGIQCFGALAILPIALYNGKRGISLKYIFYIFYPAHLLTLYFIYLFKYVYK